MEDKWPMKCKVSFFARNFRHLSSYPLRLQEIWSLWYREIQSSWSLILYATKWKLHCQWSEGTRKVLSSTWHHSRCEFQGPGLQPFGTSTSLMLWRKGIVRPRWRRCFHRRMLRKYSQEEPPLSTTLIFMFVWEIPQICKESIKVSQAQERHSSAQQKFHLHTWCHAHVMNLVVGDVINCIFSFIE